MTDNYNAISRLYRYLYIEEKTFAPESADESGVPTPPAESSKKLPSPHTESDNTPSISTRSIYYLAGIVATILLILIGNEFRIRVDQDNAIAPTSDTVRSRHTSLAGSSKSSNRPTTRHIAAPETPTTREDKISTGAILLNPGLKADAKLIQERLADLGFHKSQIDGTWSSSSATALRKFLQSKGLPYLTSWDLSIQLQLFSTTSQAPSTRHIPAPETPTTREDKISSGATLLDPATKSDAKLIQKRLADLGFYKTRVDGIWGRSSAAALREFLESDGFTRSTAWTRDAQLRLFAASSHIATNLQPFVLASQSHGNVAAVTANVKGKLQSAGFEIAGDYTPYTDTQIIVVTSDELKANAAKSERGGYGAVQRVAVTKVNGEIQVSFSNPVYWSAAYRLSTDNAATKAKLESALGKVKDYGTTKELDVDALRGYRYTVMMEDFNDPSELAEYHSYDEAVSMVEKSLAAGLGHTAKVYRVDIPGKEESVIGIALKDNDCSGDEFIMGQVDKDSIRSAAHLPYEILVTGNMVEALYARFRIPISWPHLPMVATKTGATFFSIGCAPDAIEEALIQAAGEEP